MKYVKVANTPCDLKIIYYFLGVLSPVIPLSDEEELKQNEALTGENMPHHTPTM
jgi:hypothetical protein